MLIHARWLRAISLSLSLALIVSACGSRPVDPTSPTPTSVEPAPTSSTVTLVNGIDCRGAQAGATLSMIVPWSEDDIDLFRNIVQPLIDNCGIELNISAISDVATLNVSLPLQQPDLLAWNQLGALRDYADRLRDIRQLGAQTNNYPESLLNLELADDQRLLALPLRIDITSVIWYSPARFAALGYSVPNSAPELDALIAQMSADGNVAWSMGLEAGAQSGAAGVDFVQDVLLLLRDPNYINDLIAGRVPYNDDALLEAYERYLSWTTNAASAVGGAPGTLDTNMLDALDQVFSNTPQALMIKQSGFDQRLIALRYPNLQPGQDYDFFPFPGLQSLSGTFDFMFAFSDSPATRAMIRFLSGEQGAIRMAESGFGLSPNLLANGHYSDPQWMRKAEMFATTPRVWPALRAALPSPFGAAQLRAHLDILQGSNVNSALTRATSAQQIARNLPLTLDCRGVQPGDTLSIIHPWSDAAEAHLMAVLQPLVDTCGLRIEAKIISERTTLDEAIVAAPPDALFWPNLRLSRVYRQQLQELGGLGANGQNYDNAWFNLGLLNGSFLALPVGVDIESLIWYKPAQFEAQRYQVPTTFEELFSLVDRMVTEDRIPWSMGFEAGDRTGTLGAHFAQDVMLVHRGPDFIAGIAANEFQYSDDRVVEGYEIFRRWSSNEVYTVGGVPGTLETSVLDAAVLVLGNTPDAFMIRQSNLAARAILERRPEYRLGIDYDFFPFPGAQGLQGRVDFVSVFNNTPATQLLIAYLSSATGAMVWAHDGYKLSPNRYARGAYSDPLLARQSELLANTPGFTIPLDDWIPEPFGVTEAAAVVQIVEGRDLREALADVTRVQEEALQLSPQP